MCDLCVFMCVSLQLESIARMIYCVSVCLQLESIDRVIFCVFLDIDLTLYESWMRVYFPASDDTGSDTSGEYCTVDC